MMKTDAKSVRVRFAPSPTGYLHIGSLRTALFNWLFARHHKGTFLVRIEDTDIERSKSEYTDAIIHDLKWMDLQSDEPLVIQSHRFAEHAKLIEHLMAQGKAYKDYYSQEELIELYKQKTGISEFVKAYAVCRDQPQDQDKPYVVRFKLPLDRHSVSFNDLIRGTLSFEIEQLDDFVIARSDGRPMYNFVVVADDIHQRVTHVIRGEDHISNTPKQILLYEALEKEQPIFAHLPLILGKEGQRLSKRDAATATQEYRDLGYLPDALLNYLVRLGWSHGDQEIFSREELINLFSIEEVGKKGSIFDQEKLDWINGLYIRNSDNYALKKMLSDLRLDFGDSFFNESQIIELINVYKDRSKTLVELANHLKMFGQAPQDYDAIACSEWVDSHTLSVLQDLVDKLNALASFALQDIKELLAVYAKEHNKKLGAIAQPIRIALVGGSSSPSVFELLAILGKKEALMRLERFVLFLQQRS